MAELTRLQRLDRAFRKLLVPITVLILILFLSSKIVEFRNFENHQQKLATIHNSKLVSNRLIGASVNMERELLHYFLTDRAEHLRQYQAQHAEIVPGLARLRSTLGKENGAEAFADKFAQTIEQHDAAMSRAIDLYRNGQIREALNLILGKENEATVKRLGRLGADLRQLEYGQVEQIDAYAQQKQWRSLLLESGFIFCLAAMAWYANRARRDMARTVAELKALGERHEALFAAAGDAVIIMDDDGEIDSANPAAARLFGRAVTELIGSNVASLYAAPLSPGRIRRELRGVLNAFRSGDNRLYYARVLGPGGAIVPAGINIRPFKLDEALRYVAIFRDMSEQERINRMKSEFVATVSHELRTPLTAISGSLNLLSGGVAGVLPDQARRLVGIAHESCERLVRLINDILDIEKIESGKMRFDIKPTPLIALVDRAIEANAGYAQKFDVALVRAEMLECQNVVAMVDADRFIQILNNLISNAVKFSPPHGVVTIRILPSETFHRISVSDEGPGISEEFQQRLFQKFTQADSSDARQKGGTGLGLSIVRQIVDYMGGQIGFDTAAGQGTTFRVDFPATHIGGSQEEGGCSGSCHGARLIIYHDDEQASCALCKTLCKGGFECHRARNREEAELLLARNSYAAILLGIHLAGDDPAGFIHTIATDREGLPVPVLLISMAASRGDVSKPVFLFDWVEEPEGMEELVARLNHMGANAEAGPSRPVILHVDDDFHLLQVVSQYFEDWAEVHMATDLAKARAVLADVAVDLVILDVHLGRVNGLELLPELVDADGVPLPVVIFTGHDTGAEVVQGVDALLTKSHASLSELAGTVQRLIDKNRACGKQEQLA